MTERPKWLVKVHKEAREAVAIMPQVRKLTPERSLIPDFERSRDESVRRAVKNLRITCKANKLTRLLTMTCAEGIPEERRQDVIDALSIWRKNLARRVPWARWAWILELHPSGHGWHVHVALSCFIAKETLRECWKLGFIDIRSLKRGQKNDRQEASKAAAYLAKYLAKTADATPAGKRRFSASHNCVDTVIEFEAETLQEAFEFVSRLWPVSWRWSSLDEEKKSWRGPPCLCMRA